MSEGRDQLGPIETEVEPLSYERMLLGVSAELGVGESDAMRQLRETLPEDAFANYHMLATELPQPEKAIKAANRFRIGILLSMAAITLHAGKFDETNKYIDEAREYADNVGEEELVATIDML